MAMFFFDPTKVDNVYQEGRRKGRIIKVDLIMARSGMGRYVELSVAFGRSGELVIKDRCNVENSNPTAVRIGMERLAAAYKAAGLGPCDVVALQGKIVDCELKKEPGNDGKLYLGIAEYYPAETYPQAQRQQANNQQAQLAYQAQQQTSSGAPPQSAYQQQAQPNRDESDIPF
jgi:hypothetical protein